MIKDTGKCNIEEKDWKSTLAKLDKSAELPDGKTRAELQKVWGLGPTRARQRLSDLRAIGAVEVGWRYLRNIAGHLHRVPAYKIKKSRGKDTA